MSENETTNAQDGQQDTARRVAEQDWRAAQSKLQSLEMGLMRALTSNLCERHSKQASEMPFDEFREHMEGSCHWCLLEDTNGDPLWHVKEGDRLRNWLREERDAARAECERLRAELAATQQALAQQAGKVERLKAAIGSHPLREALARQEQDTLAALAELDEMRAERDAARAECERLREEIAAIRAAMLEDVARDVDGLLEQAERFRRNLIIEARFRRNPNIEAQSRAHNTEASK